MEKTDRPANPAFQNILRDDMLRRKKALHDKGMCALFFELFKMPVSFFMHEQWFLGLDVIRLDTYAHEELGYTEEKHGSFADFTKHIAGEVGEDLLAWMGLLF